MSKETGYIKDTSNPDFPHFRVPEDKFCKGNRDLPLRVEIWDYSKTKNHTFISRGHFTVNDLLVKKTGKVETKDLKGRIAGILIVETFKLVETHSLTDYLKNGLNLFVNLGIDFTASNGQISDPASLHHISGNSGQLNMYQ